MLELDPSVRVALRELDKLEEVMSGAEDETGVQSQLVFPAEVGEAGSGTEATVNSRGTPSGNWQTIGLLKNTISGLFELAPPGSAVPEKQRPAVLDPPAPVANSRPLFPPAPGSIPRLPRFSSLSATGTYIARSCSVYRYFSSAPVFVLFGGS